MAPRKPRVMGTLAITLLVLAGSAWILFHSHGIVCDQLAPLTVLAALAAVVAALSIRQLAGKQRRSIPILCLVLSLTTLLADVRFVAKYRPLCGGLQVPGSQQR